jgi:hypothetical protein
MAKTSIDRRWLPLNALRAFEGVAKHSSFTAAANALLISQSALSRHVIALEKLIGVQLFERRPHALVLTKAGQSLLPAVIKSFDRLTAPPVSEHCGYRCLPASRCTWRYPFCAISVAPPRRWKSIW